MDLFVVVKTGVYRHDIVGVFTTLELAVLEAKAACTEEPDNYHEFQVLKYTQDKRVEDGEDICTVSRNFIHKEAWKNRADTAKWIGVTDANGTLVKEML